MRSYLILKLKIVTSNISLPMCSLIGELMVFPFQVYFFLADAPKELSACFQLKVFFPFNFRLKKAIAKLKMESAEARKETVKYVFD